MSFNPGDFFLERICNASLKEKEIATLRLNFKNSLSILGKGESATFDLMKTVETTHCEITFDDKGVPYLRNLANSGTWINVIKVTSTIKKHSLRMGDIIGLGVDPLNFRKDDSNDFVYKVMQPKVVLTIELSDSDDDDEQKPHVSTMSHNGDIISQNVQDGDNDGKFTSIDVDEECIEACQKNSHKISNSEEIIHETNETNMFEIIDETNQVQLEDAIMPTENIEPLKSNSTRKFSLSLEDIRRKREHEEQMRHLDRQKIEIIDPHFMKKRRGGGGRPVINPKIPQSIAEIKPLLIGKSTEPSKRRKPDAATKQKLAELAASTPIPEKPKKVKGAFKAKVTDNNRSTSLMYDMFNEPKSQIKK